MAKFNLSTEQTGIIEKTIKDTVSAIEGTEVVEIKYSVEYGAPNLTVYLWSKAGIDLNACETAHNLISSALDKYDDFFPSTYVLNVSSQGLDRKIVTDDDFRRALDTEIEVIAENGKSHGVLKSYDENSFTIITSGKTAKEKNILRNSTVKVQPYIRF